MPLKALDGIYIDPEFTHGKLAQMARVQCEPGDAPVALSLWMMLAHEAEYGVAGGTMSAADVGRVIARADALCSRAFPSLRIDYDGMLGMLAAAGLVELAGDGAYVVHGYAGSDGVWQ